MADSLKRSVESMSISSEEPPQTKLRTGTDTEQDNLFRRDPDKNTKKWKLLLNSSRKPRQHTASNSQSGSTKQGPHRSVFLRDYDRIVFASQFRRLQHKTQVFPLSENDNVHNRLTHSLECASVGRSLGRTFGETLVKHKYIEPGEDIDIGDIVSAACLAHDIGNPPFGHQGENAMREWWINFSKENPKVAGSLTPFQQKDLEKIEGNATGFRFLNGARGLRLTAAVLATYTKYPCTATDIDTTNQSASQKKNGLYCADLEEFRKVAEAVGLVKQLNKECWARHPLAYLVEAADDICYTVVDPEDAVRLGILTAEEVVQYYCEYLDQDPPKTVSAATIEELRSDVINKAIEYAVNNMFNNYESIVHTGNFKGTLLSDAKFKKLHIQPLQFQ